MSETACNRAPSAGRTLLQDRVLTLCAPSGELICFGCCPPIRPARYDPLDFVSSLRREFRDNRARFLREGPRRRPIVGYSCWALGYLDPSGRRIGCLLHPLQHQGQDLRSAIGYGDKCERETCLAARVFAQLPAADQQFWLDLTRGLDAFYYSSRRANPLFHLLLWGPAVLGRLRQEAHHAGWSVTELVWRQPFLLDPAWSPRGLRYLLRLVQAAQQTSLRADGNARAGACRRLRERIRALPETASAGTLNDRPASYLHQLPLEEDFRDFLRVGLGWQRATWSRARALQESIEALCVSDFASREALR
jgi:hypothetical protein